ncbi:MutS-related protein [Fulvivirga ligni]|uniref:MutS-related protein n=1 Tax=Fulvivirga ligni TaxID=2904246 RepID=UPI001F2D23A3|nr:DNA mismatch repair protein MutS [Fulvivirga ligni]UII22441.1 DNA mismatch repair protein MutS [Fulvivirga ligni]
MTHNNNIPLKDSFKLREDAFKLEYRKLEKHHALVSVIRVSLFLLTLVLIVWFANVRLAEGILGTIVFFGVAFVVIVKYHNRVKAKRDRAAALSLINHNEIKRLDFDFSGINGGEEFIQKPHPYVQDLDIFGRHSVYQLLNRCETPSGREALAKWLKHPADSQAIKRRQEAAQELTNDLEWRQNFQAAGMSEGKSESKIKTLLSWINEPNQVIDKPWPKVLMYALPVVALSALMAVIFFDASIYFIFGAMLVNGIVLKRFTGYIKNITEKTEAGISVLGSYGVMIGLIENKAFQSDYLQELKMVFEHKETKASDSILKLKSILDYLQSRANAFYLILNTFLLLDLHLVIAAEKWKRNQKADVNHWFENIGDYEALSSIAAFAYAHPSYHFPAIEGDDYKLEAQEIGHPLILPQERISNDFHMDGKGSINIITGSNMSGKSTFLRTIGVNLVLALAGSPVCARQMKTSILQIFTSMRTEDDLQSHTSSFYAELKRLRYLLDILEEDGLPVLFMLDEILKGTNSIDRHKGSSGLVRQLSDKNAMGFVSTHDLDLGELENQLPKVKNYSFNSVINGDKIVFKYKLEEGICRSFNASKLMQNIGIEVDEVSS